MTINSLLIGVNVQDVTRSGVKSVPFGRCLMFGSGTTGARGLYNISSMSDFDSKIGNASPSRKHVKSYYDNLTNPGIELLFYKVNSAAVAAVAADWTAAVDAVNPLVYSGGLVIAPELYENETIVNRKSFWDKAEGFCDFAKGSIWCHLFDINPTPATPTESDVVSEKNTNYGSAMSGFAYYGTGFREDTVGVESRILASPMVAAQALSLWSSNSLYMIPASKPLIGYKRLLSPNHTALDTMVKAGVNPIVFDDGIYQSISAVSATNKAAFYHLNTVICYKATAFYCMNAMKAYVNYEVSGDDDLQSLGLATLYTELQTCWEGRRLLVGPTAEDAFTITTQTLQPSITEKQLVFTVDCRPSYANQGVTLRFINSLI